jgi:hypothetical protein
VFINVSATDADAPGSSDKNSGGTLGFSKTFLNSAFLVSASAGYFAGQHSGVKDNTINGSANLTYKFLNRHSLTALLFYTNDKPVNASSLTPGFFETRAELAYGYSF